jgi:diguanylate cyclase (GGDEF)-like protein
VSPTSAGTDRGAARSTERLFGEPRHSASRRVRSRRRPAASGVTTAPAQSTGIVGGAGPAAAAATTAAATTTTAAATTAAATTADPIADEIRLGESGSSLRPGVAGPARPPTEPPSLDFIVSQESVVDGVAVTQVGSGSGGPTLVYVSQNLAALVGRRPDDLLGRPLNLLFGTAPPRRQLSVIAEQLAAGNQVEASHVLRHRSGTAVAVHATHCPLPGPEPAEGYRIVLFRDLSRVSGEELLGEVTSVADSLALGHDLGALCHQVSSNVEARMQGAGRCWVGVTDLENRLEAVVTGGQDLEVVGDALRLVMGTGDPNPRCVLVESLPRHLARTLTGEGIYALWAFPAVDADGDQRGGLVVAHHAEDIPSEDEVRFLDQLAKVVAVGIERAATEARLAHQALHDPLTRLPNRTLILDRLEQAIARLDREASTLSVLLVDIDRFKSLNDTWGPDIGDRVLIEVASRLLASVRQGDTVGRVSSDQFLMVCLANADLDASVVARRVIDSLEEPIRMDNGDVLHITASIGVVSVDDSSPCATSVIGNAESALASAVSSGRGSFALFDVRQQHAAVARQEMEQDLHAAISNDELVVHYQPVCEVRSGRMIGAEALVRWDRPGHGLLGPGQFIEVAEESGLIVPLGAWMIDRVAADLAGWPRSSGLSPVVTVNLSARQLSDPSLVKTVIDALERYELPPIRMGFEVTESMRIDDVEAAIDTLDELSRLGCRIAVDDFGIGHATLDYLRRFSMAYAIKLDRSFVTGLGRSKEDTAIVTATMALAEALDMKVVAEGVESFAQLDLLTELGCSFAQGYALSAPVPLDSALQLWRRGRLFEPGDGEGRGPDPDDGGRPIQLDAIDLTPTLPDPPPWPGMG